MKVVILAYSLGSGGAERQLSLLTPGLQSRGVNVTIVTLYPGGLFEKELTLNNISIICLDKRGRYDILNFYSSLYKVINKLKPDIIYTFFGTNLISFPLLLSYRKIAFVWSIRYAGVDWKSYGLVPELIYKCEALLSRYVKGAIINSHAGRDDVLRQGFRFRKQKVILNGIDTSIFFPKKSLSSELRRQWLLDNGKVLIGAIGRLDPRKDHETMLNSMHLIYQADSRVRFVIVGDGHDVSYIEHIRKLAKNLNLSQCLTWAGELSNIPLALNAFDIFISSSINEGTPNALLEAMACEIPSIATDVGDSALVLNNSKFIAPPKDPKALASICLDLIKLDRHEHLEIGKVLRKRVLEKYSINSLCDQTIDMFKDFLAQ